MKAKSTTPVKTAPARKASTRKSAQAAPQTYTAPLPDKPLVFMHIPKTGGHTLRAILTEVYGDAVCPAQNWDELVKVDVSRYKVFIGHFGYAAAHSLFGDDVDYLTFLREPNERLLSLYHYLKATNQIDPSATLDTYLTKIAPQRGEVNQMTRYLNGSANDPSAALGVFRFVGMFEQYTVDVERLARALGWSGVLPTIPLLNTLDGERLSMHDLSSDQIDLLMSVNRDDMLLYAKALEMVIG